MKLNKDNQWSSSMRAEIQYFDFSSKNAVFPVKEKKINKSRNVLFLTRKIYTPEVPHDDADCSWSDPAASEFLSKHAPIFKRLISWHSLAAVSRQLYT